MFVVFSIPTLSYEHRSLHGSHSLSSAFGSITTFFLLLSLIFIPSVSAASRNITVDDSDSRIIWSNTPPDVWNDQTCASCSAKPLSTNNINDATWHDGTHHDGNPSLTASLTFNGTAIYVYGITINSTSTRPFIKVQNLQFNIDSQPAGTYTYTPNTTDYHYNVPFFGKSGLSNKLHTIDMTVVGNSFVLVDYFVVTVPADDPLPPIGAPTDSAQLQSGTLSSGNTNSGGVNPATTNGFATPPQTSDNGFPTFAPPTNSESNVPAPSTSSSAANGASHASGNNLAGPIGGAIVGFALILFGCLFLVWYFRRRRRMEIERAGANEPPTPFMSQTETMRTASVYTGQDHVRSVTSTMPSSSKRGHGGGVTEPTLTSSGHGGATSGSRSGRSGTSSEPYSGLWQGPDVVRGGSSIGSPSLIAGQDERGHLTMSHAAQTSVVDPFILGEHTPDTRGVPLLPDSKTAQESAVLAEQNQRSRPTRSVRDRKRGRRRLTTTTEGPPAYTDTA